MTNQQAQKEARKRWGTAGFVRNSGRFSSPERRQASLDAIKTAQSEFDAIVNEIKERLAALDWYQEIQAKKREAYKRIDEAKYHRAGYRFSVGKCLGWANEIKGHGDTWEEAFAEADGKDAHVNAA